MVWKLNPGGGQNLLCPTRPALSHTQPPGTGSFPRLKQPGLGADLPSPSSTEDSNGIELYLWPPQCLHRPAMG
jgi:hypothetical protein